MSHDAVKNTPLVLTCALLTGILVPAGLLLGSRPAHAATFTVTTLTDSGPGSLRQAMFDADAAAGGDSITFAVSGTIILDAALPQVTDPAGLTIDGAGRSVTVSGNHAARPFEIAEGARLELRSITITEGRGNPDGGGIANRGTLAIEDSSISRNATVFTGNGGGIANSGVLTINNSTLTGNSTFTFDASSGGGIDNAGTLTIRNSTISGNSAIGDDGGGGSNTRGGGVVNNGTATVISSTISGNRAGRGGGIGGGGDLTISNSTISGNLAHGGCFRFFCSPGVGGGIAGQGALTVTSSTISANSAEGSGGNSQGGGIAGTAVLANTILAGNSAAAGPDCYGSLSATAPNLLGDSAGCSISGPAPLSGDPRLSALQENAGPTLTHALLVDSPAIDAGDQAGCTDSAGRLLTTDQRGQPRPTDGDGDGNAVCDIGAYEREALVFQRVSVDIKPNDVDNTINPRSRGVIPVVILSATGFDAATVRPPSVRFGPHRAAAVNRGHMTDANGDGLADLVLHFRTQETGIRCGDTSAALRAWTFSGQALLGADSIRTAGCR